MPKYDYITIPMEGQDGNAYSILGRCKLAMRRAGIDPSIIDEFHQEARSGDYDTLLATVEKWFETC